VTGVRGSGVTFDNVNNLASVVNVMFMSRHDTTLQSSAAMTDNLTNRTAMGNIQPWVPAQQTAGARPPTVLVVDDEDALRATIAYSLRRVGFEVRTAVNGREALTGARAVPPDLILLDVLLPGGVDGFETCRLLRQTLACPIILVSARTSEIDRVVGLEVGADDYVTKPFSMQELVARVRAHLRRASIKVGEPEALPSAVDDAADRSGAVKSTQTRFSFPGLSIDNGRREVQVDGQVITLKRREFDLLTFLARNHGIVLTRNQILRAVWPEELHGEDTRTVDVHVSRLRLKIETDSDEPRFVHTVRGTGYQFRVQGPNGAGRAVRE
jgi:DNA-binding response OmpR family regulator